MQLRFHLKLKFETILPVFLESELQINLLMAYNRDCICINVTDTGFTIYMNGVREENPCTCTTRPDCLFYAVYGFNII